MADVKLSEVQGELLALLARGARTGITDDRVARKLEGRGLAFHFYESDGDGRLESVWAISDAGRLALSKAGGNNG